MRAATAMRKVPAPAEAERALAALVEAAAAEPLLEAEEPVLDAVLEAEEEAEPLEEAALALAEELALAVPVVLVLRVVEELPEAVMKVSKIVVLKPLYRIHTGGGAGTGGGVSESDSAGRAGSSLSHIELLGLSQDAVVLSAISNQVDLVAGTAFWLSAI